MFNVDTMTFGMNLEDRKKETETITGRKVTIIDNNYVITVDAKIKSKLYLDDENRKKLQEVIEKEKIAKMFLFRFRRKDLDRKFDIFTTLACRRFYSRRNNREYKAEIDDVLWFNKTGNKPFDTKKNWLLLWLQIQR